MIAVSSAVFSALPMAGHTDWDRVSRASNMPSAWRLNESKIR